MDLEPLVMVMVIMRMRVMRKNQVMYMKMMEKMGTMLKTMQLMIMLSLTVGLRIRKNLKL